MNNNNLYRFGPNIDIKNIVKYSYAKIKQIKIGNIKPIQFDIGGNDKNIAIIDEENNLWVKGQNYFGQLGLGHKNEVKTLIQVANIKVKFVSFGFDHTLIIDMGNNVLVCGNNENGQLGFNPEELKQTYNFININMRAKKISGGSNYSMIIDLDDNVWVFGNNWFGQLGTGNPKTDIYVPTQILNIKANSINAGYNKSAIIDINNKLWLTNGECKFNQRDNLPEIKQLALSKNNLLILDINGNVYDLNNENKLIPLKDVKYISTTNYYSIFITSDNKLWYIGNLHNNFSYSFPEHTFTEPVLLPLFIVEKIESGSLHTLVYGYHTN